MPTGSNQQPRLASSIRPTRLGWRWSLYVLVIAAQLLAAPPPVVAQTHVSDGLHLDTFIGGALYGVVAGGLVGVSFITFQANVSDRFVEGVSPLIPWTVAGLYASVAAIGLNDRGPTARCAVRQTSLGALSGLVAGGVVGAAAGLVSGLVNGDLMAEVRGGATAGSLLGLGAGVLYSAIKVVSKPTEDHDIWWTAAAGGAPALPLFSWSWRF